MSNKRKTYGVYGIMELNAAIPCGKAKMNFPFTGGSETAYGVVPATFTTEDPLKQVVLERSDLFKSGKIKIVSETEGTGKYEVKVVPSSIKAGQQLPGVAATASAVMSTTLNPDGEPKETVNNPTESKTKEVEVADIDIARDYLVENFGTTRSSLRSKVSVVEFAEANNIRFITPDGPLC